VCVQDAHTTWRGDYLIIERLDVIIPRKCTAHDACLQAALHYLELGWLLVPACAPPLRGRFFYKVLRRHALCPPTAPRMSPGLSCRLRQGRLLGLLLQRWHRGPWFGDTAALRQGLVAQQRHPQRHPTPDATRSPTAAGSPGASALALGPTPSRRAVCWLGSARPRSRPPAGATTSPRPRLTTAAPPGREHACGGGATATPRVWCFESPGRSRRAAHTSRHHWPPAPEP